MTDTDYTDDLMLFTNTPEQTAKNISFYVNTDKTEFMCFKQDGAFSTLNGMPLKLVD